jgi:hypothetical protein
MQPLSSQEILGVWGQGENWHPLDRALLLLAAGEPEADWGNLASLPLGRRDARLLALRDATFGPRLHGFEACPGCGESLEFALSTRDLLVETPQQKEWYSLSRGGYRIRFRLPNSRDLAAMLRCSDPAAARLLLLERCVEPGRKGQSVPASSFPGGVVEALEARMAELDPQAETLLNLNCPICSQRWQVMLDIGRFFWQELAAEARRLLREVHVLASAYGWGEAEILALSPVRRQAYLAQVLG